MSQRDELANLIDDAIGWAGEEDIALAEHITDAILAAGYSRPRVVETIEELDALPEGSVVRDLLTDVHERSPDGWAVCGYSATFDSEALYLPATVLWVPEEAK